MNSQPRWLMGSPLSAALRLAALGLAVLPFASGCWCDAGRLGAY
jgi:hypothetical protein